MTPMFLALLLLLLVGGCDDREGTLGADDDDSADDDDASDDDDDDAVTNSQAVTLTTEDGLTLSGTYQAGYGASNGPAVLLLHEITRNRMDFNPVWFNFVKEGVSVLAIDFRGHGTSDLATVSVEELRVDPDQLQWDVLAALAYLQDQPAVDPDRIGIFGLDVGADLAVVANHRRATWGVKTICALSANRDSVLLLAETDTLDLESAQYVAAENEAPENAMAEQLYEETADPKDLRLILDTDDHGAELLFGSGDAQVGIPDWFIDHL
jgi:pimeloyl-ACP methyl ester carboxylesterase